MTTTIGDTIEALLQAGIVTTEDVALATAGAAPTSRSLEALVERGLVERSRAAELRRRVDGPRPTSTWPTNRSTRLATALLPGGLRPPLARSCPRGHAGRAASSPSPCARVNDLRPQGRPRPPRRDAGSSSCWPGAPRSTHRINQHYRAEGELATLGSDLDSHDDERGPRPLHRRSPRTHRSSASSTCSSAQAIADRASDIHLEPTEHDLRVRYRVDGVLTDAHRAPRSIANGVVSRLKIMADMNIAERRIPQDGRLSVDQRRAHDGPARRHPAHGVGREDRRPRARQHQHPPGPGRPRFQRRELRSLREVLRQALRDDPGHRPDRLGQVHDALRDAQHPQPAARQRDHGRGPGRVPARRHQPGADQPQGRADLRLGAALASCARTPTSC